MEIFNFIVLLRHKYWAKHMVGFACHICVYIMNGDSLKPILENRKKRFSSTFLRHLFTFSYEYGRVLMYPCRYTRNLLIVIKEVIVPKCNH